MVGAAAGGGLRDHVTGAPSVGEGPEAPRDPGMPRVLVTGAAGYLGRRLTARLVADGVHCLGTDLRVPSDAPCVVERFDVRDPDLALLLRHHRITHVVHLAAVLEGGRDRARDFDIDVNGTRNVVVSCLAAGVRHLTVASSGAAYGYLPDNPSWIDEGDPLRAGEAFGYAYHKRLVEELLAEFRGSHPELGQLVFRIGTVVGAETDNLITALFRRRWLLAVRGSESPFVFAWDEDVVGAIVHGVTGAWTGIYNVAGNGRLTIRQIARRLGKPVVSMPAGVLAGVLRLARWLRLGRYGPEQVDFLRYRPVLSNRRLQEEFGYRPAKTSAEAFDTWVDGARARGMR